MGPKGRRFEPSRVLYTGDTTYFGSLAASIVGQRQPTSFDQGINAFTWLMIRFIAVIVPAVFLINGFSKHNWLEALLFAMAVAVGLTPEMLPMIVTVNLSKGALAMARKKVIVKRLNAIQNFGGWTCCGRTRPGRSRRARSSSESIWTRTATPARRWFRVIALAYKQMPGAPDEPVYSVKDESDLIMLGFLAFLDPPKETCTAALKQLARLSVDVKFLTGDNEIVTAFICKEVGVPVEHILLGSQIETMSEADMAETASATTVFARLVPVHKERIIRALLSTGHVTGFMGDGINDAPALKAADVGISVDSAVDIAKESSDIILLENNLLILERGVLEGRRVFGNIVKYIKMAASSNFGNMFSVLGASIFLPFLAMLPIQVLTNNLLYDFSQTTIPTDTVDAEWLTKPRKWTIGEIQRSILFIGPISSLFDYLTFFIMLYVFNAWTNPRLFQTGWFVESLLTQALIIHVIRTDKIPFIESRASWPLIATSVISVVVGWWLTVSPLANTLGFVALPGLYWVLLAVMLLGCVALTQVVKFWFVRRFGN